MERDLNRDKIREIVSVVTDEKGMGEKECEGKMVIKPIMIYSS